MEPSPGAFDFAWMDRGIQILNAVSVDMLARFSKGSPAAGHPAVTVQRSGVSLLTETTATA